MPSVANLCWRKRVRDVAEQMPGLPLSTIALLSRFDQRILGIAHTV